MFYLVFFFWGGGGFPVVFRTWSCFLPWLLFVLLRLGHGVVRSDGVEIAGIDEGLQEASRLESLSGLGFRV